eukprot:2721047-Rhodomonas_salina.2
MSGRSGVRGSRDRVVYEVGRGWGRVLGTGGLSVGHGAGREDSSKANNKGAVNRTIEKILRSDLRRLKSARSLPPSLLPCLCVLLRSLACARVLACSLALRQ